MAAGSGVVALVGRVYMVEAEAVERHIVVTHIQMEQALPVRAMTEALMVPILIPEEVEEERGQLALLQQVQNQEMAELDLSPVSLVHPLITLEAVAVDHNPRVVMVETVAVELEQAMEPQELLEHLILEAVEVEVGLGLTELVVLAAPVSLLSVIKL